MKLKGLIKYYDRKKDKERIKELEEENSQYKTIKEIVDDIRNTMTEEELKQAIKDVEIDFISLGLIKKKIEELNKEEKEQLKGLKGQDRYFVKQMYQYQRKSLQELLEKE